MDRAEYLESRAVKQSERATRKLLKLLEIHHREPDPPKIVPIVDKEVSEPVEVWAVPSDGTLTIDGIKRVVCRQFGLSHTQIIANRRKKNVVYARQIAMYLCRERTPLSFPQIGKRFGDRDHTTVMHSARKIADLIKQDWKVAHDLAQIEAQL